VFNLDVSIEFFYSKTMENYISIILRNDEAVIMEGKTKCLNVQNVEPTESSRSHGKWLVAQTRWERECSWKSGYTNAPRVTASAKY
jgi:hypothetical protein